MLTKLNTSIQEFKHIVQVADIQTRLTKRHDEYTEVFERFYKDVKKLPEETVICIVGDVFHSKSDLSPEAVDTVSRFLYKCSELRPTVLVAGNHDATLNNKNRLDSLSPVVSALNHPQLHYLKSSGLFSLGNILFNNWSIFDTIDNYPKASSINKTYRAQFDHWVCLFHGTVNSAISENGSMLENPAMPVSIFDGHDIVLLGDIHLPQDLQQYDESNQKPIIRYCGSMIQQNHGEPIDDHGYTVWNLRNRSYEQVVVPNDYGFFTVEIDRGDLVTDLSKIPKKARLRIKTFDTIQSDIKSVLTKIRLVTDLAETPSIVKMDSKNSPATQTVKLNVSLNDLSKVDYQNEIILKYIKEKFDVQDDEIFKHVVEINTEINKQIVHDDLSRNVRWYPKRFEWDNMFKFGENNYIDFKNLKGIVGLFAPNRSGKSSVLSALCFCVFDKFDRGFKASELINSKKENFRCKFNFEINGVDYFIEREATLGKTGSVKVNVKFWKIENGKEVDLNEKDRRSTNDIIRDYLGTFDDFVLTALSVQSGKNIPSFIDMGNSDRKDILSQFMGLTVFDKLTDSASEKFKQVNSLIKEYKKDDFTQKLVTITNELQQTKSALEDEKSSLEVWLSKINDVDIEIQSTSKKFHQIDGNSNLDLDQLCKTRDSLKNSIGNLEIKIDSFRNQKNQYSQIVFDKQNALKQFDPEKIESSYNDYLKLKNQLSILDHNLDRKKDEVKFKMEKWEDLNKHEFDPTCEFCVKNNLEVDRDLKKTDLELKELESSVRKLISEHTQLSEKQKELEWSVNSYQEYTSAINDLNSSKAQSSRLEIAELSSAKELTQIKSQLDKIEFDIDFYNRKKNSIEANKIFQSQIEDLTKQKKSFEFDVKQKHKRISELTSKEGALNSQLDDIRQKVQKVKQIEIYHKAYDFYMKAISRDGIPYQIISSAIPGIEKEINHILDQIVDFHLILDTDGKNIVPYLTPDGSDKWMLSMASGFERFVCGIAIRVALMNVSNLPKPGCLFIDEGFGVIDPINLSQLPALFSFIKTYFDFTVIISHLDSMKDMADKVIEIQLDNGFSKVQFS